MRKVLLIFNPLTVVLTVYFPSTAFATLFDSCDSLTPENGNWNFEDDGCQKKRYKHNFEL